MALRHGQLIDVSASARPVAGELFKEAADARAREIQSYKADRQLQAPVVLSAHQAGVRVLWPKKF